MEASRKWLVPVVAIVVAAVLIIVAVAYLLLKEDESEGSTVVIDGSELATSGLVDHGTGTFSDPYVINGLDITVQDVETYSTINGIVVNEVSAHLVISGTTIHGEDPTPSGQRKLGIWVLDSSNVTILDCMFLDLSDGICLDNSRDIFIAYNTFHNCSNGVGFSDDEDSRCSNVSINGNNINSVLYGVSCSRGCSPLSIDGNVFAHGTHAFNIARSEGVSVTNNSASDISSYVFSVSLSDDVLVAGNTVTNSFLTGIALSDVSFAEVTDNLIEYGNGISLSYCDHVVISENVVGHVTGISVRDSTSIEVTRNNVSESSTGLLVADSRFVNITYCRIWGCYVGIQLLASENGATIVLVHHNDIASNDIQALDNSDSNNTWDDGAGEGNYWNDYEGVDGDSDGIGDTPLVIDEDSADRYPLMASPV